MAENPPYLVSPGSVTKSLEKIKTAATPERFTSDFVATVLGFKGGAGRALIPFYKKMGFVKSDGTPSELYNQFRNQASSKVAAAQALRIGYASLYERNEYIHKASDDDLRGVVVEVTGLQADSSVVKLVVATFKAFRAYCDPDAKPKGNGAAKKVEDSADETGSENDEKAKQREGVGLNLAYSINLHLPASDDIKVFDAIFKSLREHLLNK